MHTQYLAPSLAERHNVPAVDLSAFAAAVAEQCALNANRHEVDSAVGAQIGAAILAAFPESETLADTERQR